MWVEYDPVTRSSMMTTGLLCVFVLFFRVFFVFFSCFFVFFRACIPFGYRRRLDGAV